MTTGVIASEAEYLYMEASEAIRIGNYMHYDTQYYVYFMANRTNVALYIGVTNYLKRRVFEHKSKFVKGFTEKYDIDKLVYYEVYYDPESGILREKRLKGSSRARKNKFVESLNPHWIDLYDEI
jgi:putative endonuclease